MIYLKKRKRNTKDLSSDEIQNLSELKMIHRIVLKNIEKFSVDEELHKNLKVILSALPEIVIEEIEVKKEVKISDIDDEDKYSTTQLNYNELIKSSKNKNFENIEQTNLLTLDIGKDCRGRPIAVINEESLQNLDLDEVVLYLITKLDKFVDNDYCLVYCVDKKNTTSRPSFSWFLKIYKTFSRKYKKNLKLFFLIHPTFLYKTLMKLFKPFISKKFWSKFQLLNDITKIYNFIDKDQIPLPPNVLHYHLTHQKKNVDYNREPTGVYGYSLTDVINRKENVGLNTPLIFNELIKSSLLNSM